MVTGTEVPLDEARRRQFPYNLEVRIVDQLTPYFRRPVSKFLWCCRYFGRPTSFPVQIITPSNLQRHGRKGVMYSCPGVCEWVGVEHYLVGGSPKRGECTCGGGTGIYDETPLTPLLSWVMIQVVIPKVLASYPTLASSYPTKLETLYCSRLSQSAL